MKTFLVFLMMGLSASAFSQAKCGAMTVKGLLCKMTVKQIGDRCHFHNGGNAVLSAYSGSEKQASATSTASHLCGAMTQKGTACKRRVKGAGHCSMHN